MAYWKFTGVSYADSLVFCFDKKGCNSLQEHAAPIKFWAMINMKQALSFFCLFLLVACGGKDLGPEPRTRDEIFRELANLPVLYISKSGKRVEAPGGQGSFVDKASGEICWLAMECAYPNCPGRVVSGMPYIFIMTDPGVFVNSKGEIDYSAEKTKAAIDKAARGGFFGCEKCIPLRQKQMLQSGLGAETKADIERYASYVVPHVLPETKKRFAELEAEMVARVNWEKEQAGED